MKEKMCKIKGKDGRVKEILCDCIHKPVEKTFVEKIEESLRKQFKKS